MNREIKFKALKDDISDCRYYYGSIVYDKQGNPRIHDVDTDLFHTCIKGTECQYTGLRNNKGIEIYEGDIILSYGNKYLVEFTPCDGLKLCIIYPNYLEIKGIIQTHEDWRYNKVSGCNILGNIHENPELLNQPI